MSPNPMTQAREFAVQFLYQCESEKLFHFSEPHLASFLAHQQVPAALTGAVRELTRGTLEQVIAIDARIQAASANWQLGRMPVVDRNVLRLATHELLATDTSVRIILNEAIELARKFGSDESSRFVNGLLDRIAKSAPRPGGSGATRGSS